MHTSSSSTVTTDDDTTTDDGTADGDLSLSTITTSLPPRAASPPVWLVQFLQSRSTSNSSLEKEKSKRNNNNNISKKVTNANGANGEANIIVRVWTCALKERFTVQDKVLADTFTQLPYHDLEAYCQLFLQLAFGPIVFAEKNDNQVEPENKRSSNISDDYQYENGLDLFLILRKIRFPGGLRKASMQLSKQVFERMIGHLEQVGRELIVVTLKKKTRTTSFRLKKSAHIISNDKEKDGED